MQKLGIIIDQLHINANSIKREVLKGHVVEAGSARDLYPWMARLGRILFNFYYQSQKLTDWQNLDCSHVVQLEFSS